MCGTLAGDSLINHKDFVEILSERVVGPNPERYTLKIMYKDKKLSAPTMFTSLADLVAHLRQTPDPPPVPSSLRGQAVKSQFTADDLAATLSTLAVWKNLEKRVEELEEGLEKLYEETAPQSDTPAQSEPPQPMNQQQVLAAVAAAAASNSSTPILS